MIKAILAGSAAALMMANAADACSLVRRAPEHRPFYAHMVANAAFIDLMRVESVSVREAVSPPDADRWARIDGRAQVSVQFASVEAIKGAGGDFRFEFVDGLPFEEWQASLAETPVDPRPDNRHEAPAFWTVFDVYDTPVTSTCQTIYPRFRDGELYAILRDEDGNAVDMYSVFGRNFEYIDDPATNAWLNALRRLAAPAAPPFGRTIPVREYVTSFETAALHVVEACGDWRVARNTPLIEGDGLRLDESPSLDSEPGEIPPGRYWSTGLIYSDDKRLCSQVDENGEVSGAICPETLPQSCAPHEQYLMLPGNRFELAPGVIEYYWAIGLPVGTDERVDFTELQVEVELTGNLSPTLGELRTWYQETEPLND